MFSVDYRARVREELVAKAREDPRIESAAAVGGSADGDGDKWSDLDLTFGVAAAADAGELLEDWTRDLRAAHSAVTLFDLPFMSSIFRVFLLPGSLQVDLSFTPIAEFGALGPRFKLLFGSAVERPIPKPGSARDEFGMAAHHVVRARYCIDRGRVLQAEYWTSQLRDHALTLACRRLGLEAGVGRGFDELPFELRAKAAYALVRSIDREELLRSLRSATELLLGESSVHEDADQITSMLRELIA